MKKIFVLFFFLCGCMTSPPKAFQPDPDKDIYSVQALEIEVVSMIKHFDVLPHIENQMPASPEEAVTEWVKNHLESSKNENKKIWVIIHQAEMLQTDQPDESMFKLDKVTYTLNYQLEVQVRENSQLVNSIPVNGTGFITVAKKTSLSQKEKGWASLMRKMLIHLKTKMTENELIR